MRTLANVKTDLDNFIDRKTNPIPLDVKLKVFKIDDIKEFPLVQNLTMEEADFNQFNRLTNQLVNATESFARDESLTPVLIPTISIRRHG